MLFEVRAADGAAKLITLVLEAPDANHARLQALHLRYTPVSVKLQRTGARKAAKFNLPLFAEELQMLLNAGLSLIDAIEGLAERQPAGSPRYILANLADRLRNGERLSAALAQQPAAFPALFVGIVRAAETTSNLPAALSKFVAYDAHIRSLRERMASAAIYPIILLVVGSAVTVFLMAYVVPRFASVYRSSGRPLPWVSHVLLEGGRLLNENMPVIAVLALVLAVLAWKAIRRRSEDMGWVQLLALLPGVAVHVATIEMSRLFRTLGMLLEGGLPVRDALILAEAVMFGAHRVALARVLERVEGGEPLSEGLRNAGLSTPLALRLIEVGERSGQLGPMLERAAQFHEHETAIWIERFSKTFGPILMILISLVVGSIVIFLYIPIFDLASSLR